MTLVHLDSRFSWYRDASQPSSLRPCVLRSRFQNFLLRNIMIFFKFLEFFLKTQEQSFLYQRLQKLLGYVPLQYLVGLGKGEIGFFQLSLSLFLFWLSLQSGYSIFHYLRCFDHHSCLLLILLRSRLLLVDLRLVFQIIVTRFYDHIHLWSFDGC